MVNLIPSGLVSKLVDPEDVLKLLSFLHHKALTGLPGQASAAALVERYANADGTLEERIDQLIRSEIITSASVGFLTGLGGLLVLPVSIPSNLAANFFLQLRMATAIGGLCGLNVHTPAVKALALVCLTGGDARSTLETIGIQFFVLSREQALEKINHAVGTKLTDAVAQRLVTKLSEKGSVSLGRSIPFWGGLVSAGVDAVYARSVARAARSIFLHVKTAGT